MVRQAEYLFANDKEFALAPLGMLPVLVQGTKEPGMAAVISMVEKLHDELPNLLAEQLMLHEETQRNMSYPTGNAITWRSFYEAGYGNYQAIQIGRSAG